MVDAVTLKCPNCGASIGLEEKTCEYCHAPIVIENLNSLNNLDLKSYLKTYNDILQKDKNNKNINSSAAMCCLKLKLYDRAIKHFDAVIEENIDNSDAYLYYAVALLKGKRPFATPLADIKKIIKYLNAATMLDDKPIYHYFLAYIKYDFYAKKCLNIKPDYKEELLLAQGVSQNEIKELFAELEQGIPQNLII